MPHKRTPRGEVMPRTMTAEQEAKARRFCTNQELMFTWEIWAELDATRAALSAEEAAHQETAEQRDALLAEMKWLGQRHVYFAWIGDLVTVYNDGVPYIGCTLREAIAAARATAPPAEPGS